MISNLQPDDPNLTRLVEWIAALGTPQEFEWPDADQGLHGTETDEADTARE